jgi:hypothetical protein
MNTTTNTEKTSDPAVGALSSWRDGSAKQAIVEFVAKTCGQDGSAPVPVEERVAVFDNDGTLWCEKPMPIQMDFILRRFAEMAEADPALRDRQPWKATVERDYGWFSTLMKEHYAGDDHNVKTLAGGILAAYAGISVDDFEAQADAFLRGTQHPTLARGYLECAYAPMVDLLAFLAANGRWGGEADPHLESHRPSAPARRGQLKRRHPDARFHPARGQAVPPPARPTRRRRARVRLHRGRGAGARTGRQRRLVGRQRQQRLGHRLLIARKAAWNGHAARRTHSCPPTAWKSRTASGASGRGARAHEPRRAVHR